MGFFDFGKYHKAAKKLFLSHVGSDFSIDLFVSGDPTYKAIMKDVHDAIKASDEQALAVAEAKMVKLRMAVQEEFFTYMYLARSDQTKYGSFMTDLDNNYNRERFYSIH